eukprot:scaffold43153_cov176-Amphora_coffeaeformis.AAC.3
MTPHTNELSDEAAERSMIAQTEQAVLATYPNASSNKPATFMYVRNPANENRVLLDQKGRPVTVDRLLATKPLKQDLSTRPGPGGRRLTYITGDGVSRSLNEIFGYEGWSLDIKSVTQTSKEQDKRGRWNVAYLAHVRITLVTSGTYKEDMGSGDSADNHLQTAVSHAIKASITDALKRAARHFGDKLGNSLYGADFALNKAPTTIFQAFEEYERSTREKLGAINVPNFTTSSVENPNAQGGSINTTTTTPKMPPPPAVPNPSLPPSVTPNITSKPTNVYQRTSLGSQIAPTPTPTANNYATPRVGTGFAPMSTQNKVPVQYQQQHHNRAILVENSAALNPAPPPTAAPNLQSSFQGESSQPMARPASAWGKRPGHEGVVDTNKRPRHNNNPYA